MSWLYDKLNKYRETIMYAAIPAIFAISTIGALSGKNEPIKPSADLLTVVIFGFVGYFMRRYGYPRPAMILGLVLGDLMEKYLYRSVASYGFSWLARPAVIVLFALAGLSLFFTLRGRMKASAKAREEESAATFTGAIARSADES